MEWLALTIPMLVAVLLYIGFKKEVVWWELLVPILSSILFIFIFKFTVKTSMVSDTEYWGNKVVEARYYEPWTTWVDRTCSREVACGVESYTDSQGKTQTRTKYCTEYYDCSYCDDNGPRWIAVDETGKEYSITQEQYNRLQKKWSAQPQFVELNRSIQYNKWEGCGKDGDMYSIKWNGRPETAEVNVTEHDYTNKVQASHSSFKLPKVSEEEAKVLGLYNYPGYYDVYRQRAVLGLERIYGADSVEAIETLYQYINGHYGPKNHIKLFVCLFYNKSMEIAFKQEAYWDGGNQNEVVICMGISEKTRKIQWVKPFSWTDNKKLMVDLREDIAQTKVFNPVLTQQIIAGNISGDVHKSFKKDFDYLSVDLPTWTMVCIWLFTLVISLVAAFWSIVNQFENDDVTMVTPDYRNVRGKDGFVRHLPARPWHTETLWQKFTRKCQFAWQELKEQDKKK